jgi:hypothetical protein
MITTYKEVSWFWPEGQEFNTSRDMKHFSSSMIAYISGFFNERGQS